MKKSRKITQIILISTGLFLIVATYFLYPKITQQEVLESEIIDESFKTTDEDINTFFDNQIFAYHWHSRNNRKIEKNSYFERLEFKFK